MKPALVPELVPISDLDAGIVGWDGQDDPALPFNAPALRKWTWVGLLAAITMLTPFASSILSPAIGILSKEFGNTNEVTGSMTVSIYLLGYAVGPIFIAPLSEIYGRKAILSVSNLFFCLWQIGCALAPNIAGLIVFRFFGGVSGVASLTLGGTIIGDLFRPDQRAFAMGMWNIGPLIGPTIGPLLGGFLAKTIGWRFDFWIVLATAAPVAILIQTVTRETSHHVLLQRKTVRLQRELGRDDLRSFYAKDLGKRPGLGTIILLSVGRPLKMLVLSPLIFLLSLYVALVFGIVYLLYTTIPIVFEDLYGFDSSTSGLIYLSLGVGNILGWLVISLVSDRSIVIQAQANQGVFLPEMRLLIGICFGPFLPLSLFWYGWTARVGIHWAVPVVALVPYGFGIMGLFLSVTTYLVDSYPVYGASTLAANVILRSVVGAVIPLAGPPLYASLGLAWGSSLLGFLCLAMVPLPVVFYRVGARLRKRDDVRFHKMY